MSANLKCKLNLDALEAREVPAAIGWAKVGPQPEPPTKVVLSRDDVSILLPALRQKFEIAKAPPAAPAFARGVDGGGGLVHIPLTVPPFARGVYVG